MDNKQIIDVTELTEEQTCKIPQKVSDFISQYIKYRQEINATNDYLKIICKKYNKQRVIMMWLQILVNLLVLCLFQSRKTQLILFISLLFVYFFVSVFHVDKTCKKIAKCKVREYKFLKEMIDYIYSQIDEVKEVLEKDGIYVRIFSIIDARTNESYDMDREFLQKSDMKKYIDEEIKDIDSTSIKERLDRMFFLDEYLLKIMELY